MTLRNAPLAALNLARLAGRRAAKWLGARVRPLRGLGKRTRRAADDLTHGARNWSDVEEAARRARARAARRVNRFEDHVLAPLREERRVLGRIREVASGRAPIVVGPWLSEVGYEVLYWIPFLRWFQDYHGVPAQRMIAVSRGGVAWWYSGLASRYVDVLDVYTADEFGRQADARRTAGDQKQLDPSGWERDILADVRRRTGLADAHVLHPGLMYRLFRSLWHGDRALDFLFRHARFEPLQAPVSADDAWLPRTFAAVKFYTGPAIPDAPDTREQLRAYVAGVAARMPIVSLDTGLGLDEHRDFLFRDVPGGLDLRDRMTPATNLAVQSRVIARASLYVGTCGSLAWLAPMLGVPTVAAYADDRYLSAHLYAARYVYRRMKAARFSVVDLRALARLAA